MKRKINQASASRKKAKASREQDQVLKTDVFAGLKCFIHPANFGVGRLNIFQKLVKNNGGELYDSLPLACERVTHVIFEESLDADKIQKLIDSSQYQNAIFVRCSWLSACSKSKTKIETKDFEIKLSSECSKDKKNISFSSEQPKVNSQSTNVLQNAAYEDSISGRKRTKDTLVTTTKQSREQDENLLSSDREGPLLESSTRCDTKDISSSVKDHLQNDTDAKNASREEGNTSEENITRKGSFKKKKFFPKELKEKFACARPSSSQVKDLNYHITAELEKLAAAYKSKKDTWRALGYQKAISAIRNYPRPITSREEALSIRGVGGRLADKVAEIIENGKLRKVAEVCEDDETQTLQLFMGVWGAGPTTAHGWYIQGYRTLEDLQEKGNLTRYQQIGLKYYDDINSRIPREEVTEIEKYVRSAALSIKKGLIVMVCGSYRRGRATCGDVDVLVTHPDGQSHEMVFQPLLNKLRETGFLTDDLVTQEDNGNQKKYLGVCKLLGEDRKHRRLDVIVVPYSEFAPASMYFTGSAHFNRSMRLLAIKMGMSLSEHGLRTGIIRQKGEKLTKGQLLHTPTEESIFKHLGLDYRSPEERDH
ncbi:DNA polymerase lambda-like isoform X1 [Penaeus monodon]|uniref:DNA polymerase lambda-like isoform X1 n=2 Tax=Penaeus monodon TaxID=6687 RepID=UPI0018A72252|nr:DNA polymerase lambda-like isoform X1 [Penaeus monodon]XP_037787093.1 DNA polymerase lambda-like isoform X1 [Penaeus monodon]